MKLEKVSEVCGFHVELSHADYQGTQRWRNDYVPDEELPRPYLRLTVTPYHPWYVVAYAPGYVLASYVEVTAYLPGGRHFCQHETYLFYLGEDGNIHEIRLPYWFKYAGRGQDPEAIAKAWQYASTWRISDRGRQRRRKPLPQPAYPPGSQAAEPAA